MTNLKQKQELVLTWLSYGKVESKSFESIKQACIALCNQETNFTYQDIFYPLLNCGLIDCIGQNRYAITPPIACCKGKGIYVLSNATQNKSDYIETSFPSIYLTKQSPVDIQTYLFNGTNILSNFPTISQIFECFVSVTNMNNKLIQVDSRSKKGGLASENGNKLQYYFKIQESSVTKKVPPQRENPDALNISIYYERIINDKRNGIYNKQTRELKLLKKGISILLYRVLLIEVLLNRNEPFVENEYIIFPTISPKLVKEINRILCKSIQYE